MGWSTNIRVMNSNDEPARSVRVSIHFSGIIGTHDNDYTDSDGWVTFNYDSIEKDTMSVDKIYVDGDEVDGNLTINSGETLSYTITL